MSSETTTSPNLPRVFRRLGRYFWGGTTYLPTALHGGEVVGSGRTLTSTPSGSGEVGRSCTCPVIWSTTPAPVTITPNCPEHGGAHILRGAASQVLAFDPDLAHDLADLAADYAGPYTEQETTNG